MNIIPVLAAENSQLNAKLTVIYNPENSTQWTGISKRLESTGINYCIVPLDEVRSPADWGNRKVVFLPNIETLSPSQAIALEEWMSKGGRVIASGPVGSLSSPGVRQLLRTLFGGYWGFGLNDIQELQASKDRLSQDWVNKNIVFGKVRGGVLVPDEVTGRISAVWNAKDNPAAIVTTDRSVLFGWRWGGDTAASLDVDTAWLQAAVNRYYKLPPSASTKVEEGSSKCQKTLANTSVNNTPKNTQTNVVRETNKTPNNNKTAFSAPAAMPLTSKITGVNPPNRTFPRSDEAIDKLEQSVREDISPNSQKPISSSEAIALQQELRNLIGRVENSNLAASIINGNSQPIGKVSSQLASVQGGGGVRQPSNQSIQNARQFLNNIPELIKQKKYNQARQQWLATRSILLNQFPLDRKVAQPEIRAVWLDRGTIVRARNEAGLAQVFDRLAQAGINTVFFETLNASYPIYPSKIAPQQNPLIRGWDPLASGVKLAKQRKMEIHAWVWAFAAGNIRHNELLGINTNYPGPVLAANPDWAGYDNRGQLIPPGQGKQFFDPANPQVREYLLSIYKEIVTKYDVDGLQLDYIRYPFQDSNAGRSFGYGKAARSRFQQLYGVDPMKINPSQQDLWQKWTQYRTEQVDSFVTLVSQELRQQRPNLTLSAAVFPLPERDRIHKIQQHWEVWARRGDIDLIVPMTYALETTRFEKLAQPWIYSTQFGQLGSTLLIPGIRLLNLPTVGAFDQLQVVRDLPVTGYALFAAENLTGDLQRVFNNTQGQNPTEVEPIPHRQPFASAATRYSALRAEWKWLQENNNLQITSPSNFNEQADILEAALNQLAVASNNSKLATARGALNRFKVLFKASMRQQYIDNSYQTRSWENRLIAIEQLIRYGERVEISNSN
uniref:family 10 glycosylhydrolase n=1 Tax=Calothrix sp. PCC 6303 TaxID=1170562 RepID=UPI0002FA39A0|nr:family 10 glycosylhydrolase [Calothrix sp. PCC 6303]